MEENAKEEPSAALRLDYKDFNKLEKKMVGGIEVLLTRQIGRWPTVTGDEKGTNLSNVEVANKVIRVAQDFDAACGGYMWDAALVLLKYLETQHTRDPLFLKDKRVIELGAGTGVVGIGVGMLGAEVWVTDLWDNLDVMEGNVDRNFQYLDTTTEEGGKRGRVHVKEFDWGADEDEIRAELCPPFDFVIGSDLAYEAEAIPFLVRAMSLMASPESVILLAQEFRNENIDALLVSALREAFVLSVVPQSDLHPVFKAEEIKILSLKKK